MFGHFPELIIILALGLIVFGPEKLPEVAANAGKMVREFRDLVDTAINPRDTQVPEDFSQYYYESLTRAGEPAGTDEEESWNSDAEGFYQVDIDPEYRDEPSGLDEDDSEAEDDMLDSDETHGWGNASDLEPASNEDAESGPSGSHPV